MAEIPATFLTPKQIAERLVIGLATVRAQISSGELPAIRVGRSWRVSVADFETWLQRRRADARACSRRARLVRGGVDAVPAFMREGAS